MIVGYAARSLYARRRTVLVALLVIVGTTAAITVMLGLTNGLRAVIAGKSRPRSALVVAKNAVMDFWSEVPAAAVAPIRVLPGLATSGGKPLVSPELAVTFPIKRADGTLGDVRIRGVDPIAFEVHSDVHVVAGSLPRSGERGVLLGAGIVGKFKGLEEGGTVRIGRRQWPVSGRFTAGGDALESEIWCDRATLQQELGSDRNSVVHVVLEAPERLADLATGLGKMREFQLEAVSEQAFRQRGLAGAAIYLDAIVVVIGILCVSAVFAGTNATYSMFLGQLRELATLMTLGYTRTRVAAIVLLQSLFLALGGAGLGLGLALLAHGRKLVFDELKVVYEVIVSPDVLLLGALAAAVIGLIASVTAVVQTFRLNVLSALRE